MSNVVPEAKIFACSQSEELSKKLLKDLVLDLVMLLRQLIVMVNFNHL